MNLSIKFCLGLFISCIGFFSSFVLSALLGFSTNVMISFCLPFLSLIITCFIGFYISYNNISLKLNIFNKICFKTHIPVVFLIKN